MATDKLVNKLIPALKKQSAKIKKDYAAGHHDGDTVRKSKKEPTVSDYRKETNTMKGMAAEAKRRAVKSLKK